MGFRGFGVRGLRFYGSGLLQGLGLGILRVNVGTSVRVTRRDAYGLF